MCWQASAYGERVHAGDGLAAAERGVAETLLWHLRILAGWLPGAGAGLVRALAGWFELANIDARVAALVSDGREPAPFVLGGLATAWPRDRAGAQRRGAWPTLSPAQPGAIRVGARLPSWRSGLRVAWARRVHEAAPQAAAWVAGAGALLVARELLVAGSRAHALQLRRLPGIDRGGACGRLAARTAGRAARAGGVGAGGRERPERAVARGARVVGSQWSAKRRCCCGPRAMRQSCSRPWRCWRSMRSARRARCGRRRRAAVQQLVELVDGAV